MATVPIFDGKNYNFWCVKMRTLFLSMDLWDMVENGYEEEVVAEGRSTTTSFTHLELKERKQRDATALSKIQQGVSDSIFPIIMTATKAKEAWDILQQKYYQVGEISSHSGVYPSQQSNSDRSQMDKTLYKAAVKGNVEVLAQNSDQLEVQLTPNQNTLLHVAAQFGQTRCINEILKKNDSSLLKLLNIKGDTALHFAARNGHLKSVQALVIRANELDDELENGSEIAKEMLRAKNEDGDTTLHQAVRYQHPINVKLFWFLRVPRLLLARPNLDLVKFLVEEDPEFTYMANNAGETPLYLAAEIVRTCRSLAYDGPGGRTALHAAVINNNGESTKALLDWKGGLAKKPDMYGWTPLHYSARYGLVERVRQLLHFDKSTAYLTANEDDKKIALHIAASHGYVGVMKELISQCFDCWEMVSSQGQNILHFAVEHEQRSSINFILKDSLFSSLINQKDVNGNTPLHLLAVNSYFSWNFICHSRVDKMNFNTENWTPLDILQTSGIYTTALGQLKACGAKLGKRNVVSKDKEAIAKRKQARADIENMTIEELRKMVDSHLIVAALVATVTFAAGFTMPGGYESNGGPNPGAPILTGKDAFKAFLITDTIALMFSTSAAFIYFLSTVHRNKIRIMEQNLVADGLLVIAILAMMLAFVTGTCAVLSSSRNLFWAIFVCEIAVGSVFFAKMQDRLMRKRRGET